MQHDTEGSQSNGRGTEPESRSEFVVVANRLPVHRIRRHGKSEWSTSPGGLVSALVSTLQRARGTWIGWPGVRDESFEPFVHDGIANVPIALSRAEAVGYYEGFSNATLWPLYHDCVRPPVFRREWWEPYVRVNRRFAEAADESAAPGAIVWVHDYQLQLVPAMLRERRPDLRIGFFLHIPFPPPELFQQLPWRKSIVEGILGADVVGFQTRAGASNFARLARCHAGALTRENGIEHDGRTVISRAFPISIDYDRFADAARDPRTLRRAERIRSRIGIGRRILLGVDRLDYTKGIGARLEAFGELLGSGLVAPGECVLIQTAVPSRERVSEYRSTREEIERLVGEINGEHGSIGRPAVHYLHKTLPFEELVPLYVAADVMLVTPLRDGMNLVAKEFVASRNDERGVLVLSEFTGAAYELRSALIVNPHDIDGLAATMKRALDMSDADQRRRMRGMRRVVRRNDVHAWARSFLETLGHEQDDEGAVEEASPRAQSATRGAFASRMPL